MLVKFVSSIDDSCFYAEEGTVQYDVLKASEEYTEEVKGESKEEVKGESKEEVKGESKEEVKGESKEEVKGKK